MSDTDGITISGDDTVIKDGKFSVKHASCHSNEYDLNGENMISLDFEFTAQHTGTITITANLYYNYQIDGDHGECYYCDYYQSYPSDYNWYSHTITYTINVTE